MHELRKLDGVLVKAMASKVTDYFRSLERGMREEFQRIRAQIDDRDAKGHANEQALGTFIQNFVPEIIVRQNVEILDSLGSTSGEMDLCACNRFQLSKSGSLLLAEGVDFVVQVKAVLTSEELERILLNCGSLKKLKRGFGPGDAYFAHKSALSHTVSRIPYFVFAYESALTIETAQRRWQSLLVERKIAPELQPEGIFILDRGALLRTIFADGSIRISRDEAHDPAWYSEQFDCGLLVAFVSALLTFGRGILRVQNPLHPYLAGTGVTATTTEMGFGGSQPGDLLEKAVWEEILASYRARAEAACGDTGVVEECLRRKTVVESIIAGAIPADALDVRNGDTDEAIAVQGPLLNEIQLCIRHLAGKHPALSPAPSIERPFDFDSTTYGGPISVRFRHSFVADLQHWPLKNCSFFRPKK